MKGIVTILFAMMFVGISYGQKAEKETVKIKTSAECGMCKEKIEGELNYMKGVLFAELDVASKVLTVKYNSAKVSLDSIRKKIASIGYSADDVKADAAAVKSLPACCKPGGMKK